MKTRVAKKWLSKAAVLSGLTTFSSLAMAHNSQTASSLQATLAHQFASPDHLLVFIGVVGMVIAGVVFGPSLYRRIRQDKR